MTSINRVTISFLTCVSKTSRDQCHMTLIVSRNLSSLVGRKGSSCMVHDNIIRLPSFNMVCVEYRAVGRILLALVRAPEA